MNNNKKVCMYYDNNVWIMKLYENVSFEFAALISWSHPPSQILSPLLITIIVKVSYGRQSYLELKSMLLFKQDFLYSNPYAVEVLNKTKLI